MLMLNLNEPVVLSSSLFTAHFFFSSIGRAAYIKQQKDSDEKNQVSQEQERVAMQLIDWHSFVVVETITFVSDDEEFLPQPKTSIEDINRMLAAQELEDATRQQIAPSSSGAAAGEPVKSGDGGDMDMDMDMNEDNEYDDEPLSDAARRRAAVIEAEAAEEEPMVVKEYEALLEEQRLAAAKSTQYQKCPICKEEIAVEDLSEHMRYILTYTSILSIHLY
jgi:splicing factor 3A subunit 1